jgi:hypothetical protein
MAGSFAVQQSKTILPLFEIALVLVCFNHVARIVVNANHSITARSQSPFRKKQVGLRAEM